MSTPLPPKVYAKHLRLTLLGSMGVQAGSLERFSIGLNLQGDGSLALNLSQAFVDDLAADCRAFWIDSRNLIGSQAKLDMVKVARIGTNGKYEADPFINTFAPVSGAAIGANHPFQVSLGVSLNTARRGATGRGRFFLPCPSVTLQGDGLVEPTAAQGVANACAQFITNINNTPGVDRPGTQVVVASSKGVNSPVVSVRVGRALDTIRSRRAQLKEQYGAAVGVS